MIKKYVKVFGNLVEWCKLYQPLFRRNLGRALSKKPPKDERLFPVDQLQWMKKGSNIVKFLSIYNFLKLTSKNIFDNAFKRELHANVRKILNSWLCPLKVGGQTPNFVPVRHFESASTFKFEKLAHLHDLHETLHLKKN